MEESVLSKLSRHEPTLERQLYGALHDLERPGKPPGVALPSRPPTLWTSRSRGCPKKQDTEIRGPHGGSSA